MPKLQLVSGKQAVKKFEQLGYKTTRQTGSHIRLWHFFDKNKKTSNYSRSSVDWPRVASQNYQRRRDKC